MGRPARAWRPSRPLVVALRSCIAGTSGVPCKQPVHLVSEVLTGPLEKVFVKTTKA